MILRRTWINDRYMISSWTVHEEFWIRKIPQGYFDSYNSRVTKEARYSEPFGMATFWQLQNQRQNPVRNGKFRCTVNFTNHLNKMEREMITTKSRHSSNTTTDVTLMTNASCVLNLIFTFLLLMISSGFLLLSLDRYLC